MQELIGKKVTVSSLVGPVEKYDIGVIESFDGTILKLKKETETVYFVIHSVRMIKPF